MKTLLMVNNKILAIFTALGIGFFGIVGLFVDGHLLKLINVDMNTDILRLVIAAVLILTLIINNIIYIDYALFLAGLVPIAIAITALFDSTIGSFAPSGYTGMDIFVLSTTGIVTSLFAYASLRREINH